MSRNNNNNKGPDRPDRKPNDKGKGRATEPEPLSPTNHNRSVPGTSSAGAQQQLTPAKRRKTKAEKWREQEEVEDEWDDEDPIACNLAGPDPRIAQAHYFLSLPKIVTNTNPSNKVNPETAGSEAASIVSTQPSPATIPRNILSSVSSLLRPPSYTETSSSASSKASKRHREPSPPPQRGMRPISCWCHALIMHWT